MGIIKNLFSNTDNQATGSNSRVITKHNVPDPKKVVSLIGWEKCSWKLGYITGRKA